jgi:hypothetical protein
MGFLLVQESHDLLDFLDCVRGPASVQVKIPLEDFTAGFEVVDVDVKVALVRKAVRVVTIELAERRNLVVEKAQDRVQALLAVHEDERSAEVALPARAVKIKLATGDASFDDVFHEGNLLFLGPDVGALKVRVDVELAETVARLNPTLEELNQVFPVILDPVARRRRKTRQAFESLWGGNHERTIPSHGNL